MIFWSVFEMSRKKSLKEGKNIEEIAVKTKAALISGLIASFLTYPFDII